jgi:hypothetical protein
MRFPIKIARDFVQKKSFGLLPTAINPRALFAGDISPTNFGRAVSTFKFGSTFKTTKEARFPQTVLALSELYHGHRPVVLDVGASDGSASLHVMDAIKFSRYYVTDLNTDVYYEHAANATWFYDQAGQPVLHATDRLVTYADYLDAVFPFAYFARRIFGRAPVCTKLNKLTLVRPEIANGSRDGVVVCRHDVSKEWNLGKVDLVLAANLLNRAYFSDDQIAAALGTMKRALSTQGRIAIVDNRVVEQSTILGFRAGEPFVEARIGPGTEIEDLALRTLS